MEEEVLTLRRLKTTLRFSDNITEVRTNFFRNQGTGLIIEFFPEERTCGFCFLLSITGRSEMPMYKVGDKIGWEYVPTQDSADSYSSRHTSHSVFN